MKLKAMVQRALALDDVDQAITYYLEQDAGAAASGFVDAFVDSLKRAYIRIGKNPATGSPPYAHALDTPGLRSWPFSKYPYLVFYVERTDHIDVWRVLHMQRNIPAWMTDGSKDE